MGWPGAASHAAPSSLATVARRFMLVGTANTALDYLVFIGLTKFFHIPLERVWIAKSVSGLAAVGFSFALNRTWVFRLRGPLIGQAWRFVAASVAGVYAVQTPLTQLFSSVWPQPGEALFWFADTVGVIDLAPSVLTEAFAVKTGAFALATAASTTWNFCAYRYWVFAGARELG